MRTSNTRHETVEQRMARLEIELKSESSERRASIRRELEQARGDLVWLQSQHISHLTKYYQNAMPWR